MPCRGAVRSGIILEKKSKPESERGVVSNALWTGVERIIRERPSEI